MFCVCVCVWGGVHILHDLLVDRQLVSPPDKLSSVRRPVYCPPLAVTSFKIKVLCNLAFPAASTQEAEN